MSRIKNFLTIGIIIFGVFQIKANISDTLLTHYGLSSDYFEIVTVKEAKKDVFRNLFSDAIKPSDTIIIAKVDTFKNDLIIKNKLLKHRLILSGKVFKKGVSFRSSKFQNEVFMNECTFYGRVDFGKATFDSTLILWKTKFYNAGVFSHASFNGIQFHDTQFFEDVQFYSVQFKGGAFFISTKFKKEVLFNNSYFYDYTNFGLSEFDRKPMFWQTIFLDTLVFYSVKLKSGIDFQSSKFGHLLGLHNLESNGKIDLSDVSLPYYTDLTSIKTDVVIDFNFIRDSIATSIYKVNIYDTDINKLMLTDKFDLYFNDYLSLDIKNGIYKELLDNLFKKGYKNLYRSFDIEYKRFIYENYNQFSERISYLIGRTWWNFGYNKQRVFLWTLIFIFLFSIPIRLKFNLFVEKVYRYDKLLIRLRANRKLNNSIIRFLLDYWLAFVYTIFVFFNLKLDFDKLSFNNYFASAFILIIYVLGLICTAFIVNLVITI